MLKSLRRFPGAKTEKKRFLLSQGKLCFAKIASSGRQSRPCGLKVVEGLRPSGCFGAFACAKAPVFCVLIDFDGLCGYTWLDEKWGFGPLEEA